MILIASFLKIEHDWSTKLASSLVGQVLNLHGRQLRRIAPEAFDAIHGALAECYYTNE